MPKKTVKSTAKSTTSASSRIAKSKSSSKGDAKATGRSRSKPAPPAGDWREAMLGDLRRLILGADPEMVEERKWIKPTNPAGVPMWSHAGIVCTGEIYKEVVKLTFFRGASLEDPNGLFNPSLDGGTRRAIDIRAGEKIDPAALQALIREAVAENLRSGKSRSKSPAKEKSRNGSEEKPKPGMKKKQPPDLPRNENGVVILSGGNPQIAKGDGDAPVQKYIANMPGWKRSLGRRLDQLIERAVPNVQKAVRWNSPFYGVEGQGWFLSFHVLTKYVKVTFFAGRSLNPIPPGGTPKSQESRWLDIYEDDQFDEAQFSSWVNQAAALPGWTP